MKRTRTAGILMAAVAIIGLATVTGFVAAGGNLQEFSDWQSAFEHLAGRVANLESKHSIVCSTLLGEYDSGSNRYSFDTAQEAHARGLSDVEDYLDRATSGTHYETRWTRAGAEAEYKPLHGCQPGV